MHPVGHAAPATKHLLVRADNSPIAALERTCTRIAVSDSTVLLTGETGTGTEVFARLIHAASPRAGKLLIPVNCGAIPEALLESELFGYVRGAFTGATSSRRGRLAAAEGGTLFLDEIGELPLSLQVKLLRVLQDRTYEPVGSTQPVPADFRLVAATNRDLEAEVEAGRFRRDLYFRLLVCPIELPPLRERPGDIQPLFRHFWTRRGEDRPVEASVFRALQAHAWPGNIRELENLVERLSVCVEGGRIRLEDLPSHLRGDLVLRPQPTEEAELRSEPAADLEFATPPECRERPCANQDAEERLRHAAEMPETPAALPPAPPAAAETSVEGAAALAVPEVGLPVDLPKLLRELEERFIDMALQHTGGNKRAAADMLGLQRTTLVEKLRRRQTASAA